MMLFAQRKAQLQYTILRTVLQSIALIIIQFSSFMFMTKFIAETGSDD